jgi:hypothetical protein
MRGLDTARFVIRQGAGSIFNREFGKNLITKGERAFSLTSNPLSVYYYNPNSDFI